MFQKYSELCLLVFGCMERGRGGAKTQSFTTAMLSKEVFDKATFNQVNICTNQNEH
jgi:hypothetical protein